MRKLLKTKLYNRNLIKGINTWVIPLVRYSGTFLKWIWEQESWWWCIRPYILEMMLTDYMCQEKKEEDLSALKIALIQQLEEYIGKYGGRLVTVTRNNTDNTRIHWIETTRKQKWEEKQLYGRFKWQLTWENMDVAKKRKP